MLASTRFISITNRIHSGPKNAVSPQADFDSTLGAFRAMKLINPNTDLQKSYVSYIEELGDEERYPYPLDLKHKDFKALVRKLELYSKGLHLPDWLVPNTTFWLVEGNKILGCSHLRHCLNAELEKAGGHIGLGIRPSARGKGLGKILLNATIDKAVKMGIEKIHIHCYADNMQSRRMIESIGAVLESAINLDLPQKTVMRYVHDGSSY
ncbi:GNAT family acetyltransferase [Glaciecola nitratireducens FR1064]|uniref:GNAT family acetyltransferase n=2 Tax=Brumicola TaxID=3160924 RepID=G4QNG3_GLANF|nr:GNAT family acetyltransferase [Glaciecola nitratireducens FR1064]